MALDLDAVGQALAAAVTAAAIQLNGLQVTALDYVPEAPTPPLFAVAEFTNTYHQSYGAMDRFAVTCRLFAARGDDRVAQRLLRKAMSNDGAATSVVKALEAARQVNSGSATLGGAAADLVVQSVRGPRMYSFGASEVNLYGLEFTVLVIG